MEAASRRVTSRHVHDPRDDRHVSVSRGEVLGGGARLKFPPDALRVPAPAVDRISSFFIRVGCVERGGRRSFTMHARMHACRTLVWTLDEEVADGYLRRNVSWDIGGNQG